MPSLAKARAAAVAAAAALALGTSAALPATARADTGWDRCPPGYSCYFSDADGGGDLWKAPSPGCFDLGRMNPPFNDRISSVWNRGGDVVHMYNWDDSWQWVADVQVGQKWSVTWSGDSRNDVVDMVCIGRTAPGT